MAKKQNLKNTMKSELYRQFYEMGQGRSRDIDKQITKEFGQLDSIPSRESLKTHLSQISVFSDWVRENTKIIEMQDITIDTVSDYLQFRQDSGMQPATINASLTAIHHVLIGSQTWEKEANLDLKSLGLRTKSEAPIINNRKPVEHRALTSEQERIDFIGKAFGLRSSELMTTKENPEYALNTHSLYEKDKTLYVATLGKNGKFRTVECLKSLESDIKAEYSQYINEVDRLPNRYEYKQMIKQTEPIFSNYTKNHNMRIHVNCRQYYVDNKLQELKEDERYFELMNQHKIKTIAEDGHSYYRTNGLKIERSQAQFVSLQLGHNRLSVLSKYANLGCYEE